MISDEDEQVVVDWLANYINANCIYRCNPAIGETLKNKLADQGGYVWQYYLRRGLYNHTFMSMVGHIFWKRFHKEFEAKPFQLSGLETAASPMIIGIAMIGAAYGYDCNTFIVRKERKIYGLENIVEGMILPGVDVLLVDDLAASGNSMLLARANCQDLGLKVMKRAFTIVRKDQAAAPDFVSNIPDMEIEYIFDGNIFPKWYDETAEWDLGTYDFGHVKEQL